GTASTGGLGTYGMTEVGRASCRVGKRNSTVESLNNGQSTTDTFTVTTVDGTAKVVTITINGTNDAAVISGTATGSVVEAGGGGHRKAGTPTASGALTDSDVDNTPNTFTAAAAGTASTGGLGTYGMTAGGIWTYTLDNSNSTVESLNNGQITTDTFTVTTTLFPYTTLFRSINGTNDAAVISGTATGSVV